MWRRIVLAVIDLLGLAPKPVRAVPYNHSRYGHFGVTRDRLGRLHDDVQIDWLGQGIAFAPFALQGKVVPESFDTIDALMEDQPAWHERAISAIMENEYPLWLEEWRDENSQPALGSAAFLQQLRLDAISLGPDDHFTMWFDPGELFHGHWIEVRCSLSGGVREVALAG